ncbi:hypothetical protein [Streptomyces tubercidicus]|uniref:hypothetical protein n=1 Tax=Streptomyces tubercidicus TaxID=47759 RepID=UPI00368787C1
MSSFLAVALAIPLSLLATTPAHAEDPVCDKSSNTGCITITRVQHEVSGMARTANPNGPVDLLNDDSSDSNDLVLRPDGTAINDQWSFKPNPNSDGSFQIANNIPSKSGCVESDENGYLTMNSTCDATQTKQLFYAQPVNDVANTYLIRRVDNDQCVSSHWDQYAVPYAGGTALQINTRGCTDGVGASGGDTTEQWTVTAAPGDGATGSTLDDLATQYALTQRNKESGVITSSSYTITDDSEPAHLGPYSLVSTSSDLNSSSPVCKNSSTDGDLNCAFNWSSSTTDTVTESSTVGVNLTLGPGKYDGEDLSPLKSDVQVGYQHTWTSTQTSTETSGTNYSVQVPPGQTAWLARALALKTTTGDWTFSNDVGSTWTHHMTVTLPVEGVDGAYSVIAKCSTDSTAQECIDTKPAGV